MHPRFSALGRRPWTFTAFTGRRKLVRPQRRKACMPHPDITEHDLFKSSLNSALQIEGMLTEFSIAAMDMLLSFQERSTTGNIVEVGVFRGRSAAVLAHHLRANERLTLVDVADHFDRAKLLAINSGIDFLVMSSEQFAATREFKRLKGSCRVVHIDASHQFAPTLHEMRIAEKLLNKNGIIMLDDFANLNYSQNIAA